MRVVITDGGRTAAGFTGSVNDCVTRAIAIVTDIPYADVYRKVNATCHAVECGRRGRIGVLVATGRGSSARNGTRGKTTTRAVMASFGLEWVPTMQVGAGCTVHLRASELPGGRIIAAVSKHVCAVIDGVVHDDHDPTRGGSRCVYGYWTIALARNVAV